MVDLSQIQTEASNPHSINLDQMSVKEALVVMNNEDKKVAEAIEEVLPEIEEAIHTIIGQLKKGGRIIYIGAGTSGRLGVLDAVECPPTFGTDKGQVVGLIAGGDKAFVEAVEGSEDRTEMGQKDLEAIELNANDVVVGIAASGRTPYVIGGLEYANSINTPTIAVACSKNSQIGQIANIAIEPTPGPEILTGSTRLKAGSSQKMVLNMLSTLSMVGIGKVYKNLMVDVQQSNKKLVARAENIVVAATDADIETAREALKQSDGSVKKAIIMILLDVDKAEAEKRLEQADGHVRKTL